jgi:hypothetical protein
MSGDSTGDIEQGVSGSYGTFSDSNAPVDTRRVLDAPYATWDINPVAKIAYWTTWGIVAAGCLIAVAMFYSIKETIDESEGTPEDHAAEVAQWNPLWQISIAAGALLFILAALQNRATNMIFTCFGTCQCCRVRSDRTLLGQLAANHRGAPTGGHQYRTPEEEPPRKRGGGRRKIRAKNAFGEHLTSEDSNDFNNQRDATGEPSEKDFQRKRVVRVRRTVGSGMERHEEKDESSSDTDFDEYDPARARGRRLPGTKRADTSRQSFLGQ